MKNLPFGKEVIQNPIKTARKNLGMTQEELAEEINELLDRHLTKKDICRWENCDHKPNREVLVAIAKISNQDIPKFISSVHYHFERTNELLGRKQKYATHY